MGGTVIFNKFLRYKRHITLKPVILSLLALVIILAVLPLVGYHASAKELTIENVDNQPGLTESQSSSPQIQVITSLPSVPISSISTEDRLLVQEVDYSRYFVIIAFFGPGSSYQDRILNIWQFKSVIWVRSDISTNEDKASTVSYYQIVKINKSQMTGYGEILFRLLNGFEEKARIVQQIFGEQNQSG